MDAFVWGVVSAVAGVVAALAAVVALLPRWRDRKGVSGASGGTGSNVLPAGAKGHDWVVVGEIPQQPLGFQPRADLLAALDAPGARSQVVVVHAVTGMRGVGKTHLAAAYARARLAERWRLVAWINADDLGGVRTGLAAAATALDLSTSETDDESAGLAVRHWLEIGGDRCLLVFDNATDPAMLQRFIPATGTARVIITSNQRSMMNLGTGVPVDVFSEAEALALLAERTGLADAEGGAALAVELGYLPLALAQAAAVIADQHLTYNVYLDRLRSMPVGELLRPVVAGQYPRGVAAAVLLSLDGIRAGDDTGSCNGTLELLAVLSTAGVRRSLVHTAGRLGLLGRGSHAGALSPEAVDRALARLAGTSLLTFSVDGSSVSVHRLVARVIREQMARGFSLRVICTVAGSLLGELTTSLDWTLYENRAAVRDLIEQIMALYESSADCRADPTLMYRMIMLRSWAIRFLAHVGDGAVQCIPIAEQLLADQERLEIFPDLSDYNTEILDTRETLAIAYQDVGRTAEAIELLEQTRANRERVKGGDHRDSFATLGNLAEVYKRAGRTADAIELHEQLLADQTRLLGADHHDTLATRDNLAVTYRVAGRTAEAIELHEQLLTDETRLLGADHPDVLDTRNNLAAAYRAAGRTAEAIALHEQVLADRERLLGLDHPDTLNTRMHLALDYHEAGRDAEAVVLYKQTLAKQRDSNPQPSDP